MTPRSVPVGHRFHPILGIRGRPDRTRLRGWTYTVRRLYSILPAAIARSWRWTTGLRGHMALPPEAHLEARPVDRGIPPFHGAHLEPERVSRLDQAPPRHARREPPPPYDLRVAERLGEGPRPRCSERRQASGKPGRGRGADDDELVATRRGWPSSPGSHRGPGRRPVFCAHQA